MSKSEVEFIALKHDFVSYNTSHIAKHKTETNIFSTVNWGFDKL